MKPSKLKATIRSYKSKRFHVIFLYFLIFNLTILCGLLSIYFSRIIRAQTLEINHIKERLNELELKEITISTLNEEYDPLQRRLRHASKSSILKATQNLEESDLVLGSIHFKVPVRRKNTIYKR